MKKRNIILCSIITLLSFVNIINTSALSYQTDVGVSFTFNPTLSVSISPSDLTISNLTPGTTDTSNEISINVSTNNVYGYNLYATVGNSNYSNTNLTHSSSNDTFTSISTTADLSNLTTDNTWGYTYSLDNGTTWSNYNGLPLYTTDNPTRLKKNTGPSEDTVNFKIAAKSSTTQPSGTYTNVINFTAITKPTPVTLADAYASEGKELYHGYYKMQDMTHTICEEVEDIGAQLQVIDVRDDKVYWIAKLKDNHCWMTQNLDLAGDTVITNALSDVPEGYVLPTANGFQSGNRLPTSSQEGFSDNTKAYVYNTNNHTDNCSSPGCYSYYSWHAATAGSGVNIIDSNVDAPYSICPKGWKLPTAGITSDKNWKRGDFYALATAYGAVLEDGYYQYSPIFYNNAGPNTIPNLLLTGRYDKNSFGGGGGYAVYLSSTVNNGSRSYSSTLCFDSSSVYVSDFTHYRSGHAIRCLAHSNIQVYR